MTRQSLGSSASIRHIVIKRRKSPARTDHRLKEPAGRNSAPKVQAIRDDALHAKVLGKRTHDVVECLADQDNIRAGADQFPNLFRATFFQVRLELVLEVFFAQQIEPVLADPAQNRMNHAGGELTVGGVQNGAQNCH